MATSGVADVVAEGGNETYHGLTARRERLVEPDRLSEYPSPLEPRADQPQPPSTFSTRGIQ